MAEGGVGRILRKAAQRHSWGVGSVVAVRTGAPVAVLTFDDGPDPVGTPAILRSLGQAGATATFFVLMTRVHRYRSLVDQIVQAGHEVGLHGVDHRPLPALPAAQVYRRCRSGKSDLEAVVGSEVRWLRPPYGRQTPASWSAARAAGLTPVFWSGTSWDWKEISDDERIAKAMSTARPGQILLNHDGHADGGDGVDDGPAPRIDRGELVSRLLGEYAARGLRAVSLTEALRGGRARRVAHFTR